MDHRSFWTGGPISEDVDALEAAWAATSNEVVAVTSEVGQGVIPATPAGRHFRDELGRLNQRIAAVSDEVWLVTAGLPTRIK
jgi:adenosylcobinamide kinase/adenosylcobinamide-phosphate guanylyltransferase